MTRQELLARLRRKNAALRGEPLLDEEATEIHEAEVEATEATIEGLIVEESIAMLEERPVLPIKKDRLVLEFREQADRLKWESRLKKFSKAIDRAIPSVGRVELTGSAKEWVGTGWIVENGVLVTNRHVALEFAERDGEGFVFQTTDDGERIRAHTDFAQEIDGTAAPVRFELVRPLWVEDRPGPDVAFFEIRAPSSAVKLPPPLKLAAAPTATPDAGTIGYPAYDSRIAMPEEMNRIFGETYNRKRFAPGGVSQVTETRIEHDCTTLGGNSGSVVLDLETGQALGLHFSGSFLDRNYAVRSDVVRRILDGVKAGRTRVPESTRPPRARGSSVSVQVPAGRAVAVPVTVTVSVGAASQPASASPRPPWRHAPPAPPSEPADEARPEDYRNRRGYAPGFLLDRKGRPVPVAPPAVVRDRADVLEFKLGNKRETTLRYEHFEVQMSRSRRLCFFSAANIDGGTARKARRVSWKWDPRIPASAQIMDECYGSAPKFSRGHMTRREDPSWGTVAIARLGNQDSMHVTNACPQMQAFNSPIWLALEDYALQHAREDQMRISVFTGPYFRPDDPPRHDVLIPASFWKVITFVHERTGKLCATGYEMNQEGQLPPEEEFVFGEFLSPQLSITTQVPVRTIEARAGLRFDRLASVDPLAGKDEAVGGGDDAVALAALEEIRFLP